LKTILITIFIAMSVLACADTARITQDSSYGKITLNKSSIVYVSLPKDGQYGDQRYSGSGQSVTTIIRSSLLKHLVRVDEGVKVETYKQAVANAQSNSVDYLFFPMILHWEDRATEWSGIPDKVQVKIIIIDMKTSETISSTTIDGSSGIATFGGDHPQDLLPGPVTKFVDGLFK
jgi:hypothetical protein